MQRSLGQTLFNVLVGIPRCGENGTREQRREQRWHPLWEEGAPDHCSCPLQTPLGSPLLHSFNGVTHPAVNPGVLALTS